MIKLSNVVKTFAGPTHAVAALRGVSLEVGAGEIFGIIGRSGAGKSTLIRSVNLLEPPTSGQVFVAGQELTALDAAGLRRARRQIGMIFQHFNLLAGRTALENVALPFELAGISKKEALAKAAPLLELVSLTDQSGQYPSQLSGGQKQRVGIARALANGPRVLLSDEATSALDPETTRNILALLQDIRHRLGLTILLITHEMTVVKQICDKMAVLEAGEIVEQGPTFDIFARPRTATARSLLGELVAQELPQSIRAKIEPEIASGRGTLLRIVFSGAHADQPVLSDVSRRYNLDMNVLYGRVDEIQGASFGALFVLAQGTPAALAEARTYLEQMNLRVENVADVAATDRAAD